MSFNDYTFLDNSTEEYVTMQSCIDEVKEKGVFVLATVNNIRCLPRSLVWMDFIYIAVDMTLVNV